ncbi:MAG: helix-turn-helix domain-containing protein [Spirochaetes bacterium]|nr:helix-turn-helix domain-containing protein [Spirochaetota bacterium]
MDKKIPFLSDYLKKRHTMSEFCDRYNIGRNTGYGILDRYIKEGPAGLVPKSQRLRKSPTKTAPKIEQALIATRLRHPTWEAKRSLLP